MGPVGAVGSVGRRVCGGVSRWFCRTDIHEDSVLANAWQSARAAACKAYAALPDSAMRMLAGVRGGSGGCGGQGFFASLPFHPRSVQVVLSLPVHVIGGDRRHASQAVYL